MNRNRHLIPNHLVFCYVTVTLCLILLSGCDSSKESLSKNPRSDNEDFQLVIESRKTLPVGFSSPMKAALVSNETGVSKNVPGEISMSSSDISIVNIIDNKIHAKSVGEAEVTAVTRYQGETYRAVVPMLVTDAIVDSLTILAPKESIGLGAKLQYKAIAQFDDGTSLEVTQQPSTLWRVNDTNRASIVASTGLLTALSPGEVYVELQGFANGISFSGSKLLTVTEAEVVDLTVTPSTSTLTSGMTKQYTATALYSDSTTNDVTSSAIWSTDAPEIATINASNGILTVGPKSGKVTISASYTVGNSLFSDSAHAFVDNNDLSFSSFSISPGTASIPILSTSKLSAIAVDENGNSYDVSSQTTWTLNSPVHASISTQGKLTVKEKVSSSPLEVTANYKGLVATARVSISESPVRHFAVSPQILNLSIGLSKQLVASLVFESGQSLDFTSYSSLVWSSDDPSIVSITASGFATAQATGSTLIRVSGDYNGESFSDSVTVRVAPATVKSIMVTPTTHFINDLQTKQFNAKAILSDLREIDLTDTPSISWSSSDTSIATIDGLGLVTGMTPGTVDITAVFQEHTDTVPLTVINSSILDIVSMAIKSDSPPIIPAGTQANYYLELTSSTGGRTTLGSASTYSYVSSDPTIASINASSGQLTAHKEGGPVTISINGDVNGMHAANTTVLVSSAELVALSLEPSNLQARVGIPINLTVTKYYSDGSEIFDLSSLTWTSRDPSIGTVDTQTGAFTPLSEGTTIIRVTDNTFSHIYDISNVEVLEPVLQSFEIHFEDTVNEHLVINETSSVKATGTWTDGSTRDITYLVNWSTSPQITALITHKGQVEAKQLGELTISAEIPGLPIQSLATKVISPVSQFVIANRSITLPIAGEASILIEDQNGNDIRDIVNFSTSDESIATVTNNGLVQAVGLGRAEIIISLGDLEDTVTLSVPTDVNVCDSINSTTNDTNGACLKVTSTSNNTLLFTASPSIPAVRALEFKEHSFIDVRSPGQGVPNTFYAVFSKSPVNNVEKYCSYLGQVSFLNRTTWRLPEIYELEAFYNDRGPLGDNFNWPYPANFGYRALNSSKVLDINTGVLKNDNDLNSRLVSCVAAY
ncbi:Ig-like domain-containing protein [Vibrio barjaei]|uniref:Ig-like domain-containing protein n=1 Tax=Vibrio barjaei TaxID=1676683 RepID=A0ABW7IDR4_9VIBR